MAVREGPAPGPPARADAVRQHAGPLPYSPLARGRLTRPRVRVRTTDRSARDEAGRRRYQERDRPIVDRVVELAHRHDVPPAQIALAWLTDRDGVVAPVVGATRPEHLDDAVPALSLRLTAEETAWLEEQYRPHEVRGSPEQSRRRTRSSGA